MVILTAKLLSECSFKLNFSPIIFSIYHNLCACLSVIALLYTHKSDRLKSTEEQGVSGTSLALWCRLGDWIRARVAGRRAVRSKSIQQCLRTAIVDLRVSVNKGAIKHGHKGYFRGAIPILLYLWQALMCLPQALWSRWGQRERITIPLCAAHLKGCPWRMWPRSHLYNTYICSLLNTA